MNTLIRQLGTTRTANYVSVDDKAIPPPLASRLPLPHLIANKYLYKIELRLSEGHQGSIARVRAASDREEGTPCVLGETNLTGICVHVSDLT